MNMMTTNQTISNIARTLVIIGAVNWGSIGLFETDIVQLLLPEANIARVIYTIVGIAGIVQLYNLLSSFSANK